MMGRSKKRTLLLMLELSDARCRGRSVPRGPTISALRQHPGRRPALLRGPHPARLPARLPQRAGVTPRPPPREAASRSARGCHRCLRYDLLPMCPGRTKQFLERAKGFEPRPRPWQGRALPLSYTRIREAGGDGAPATGRAMPNAAHESDILGRQEPAVGRNSLSALGKSAKPPQIGLDDARRPPIAVAAKQAVGPIEIPTPSRHLGGEDKPEPVGPC